MKRIYILLAVIALGSCKRHYNVPSEVSTTDNAQQGPQAMDPELLRVTTFDVDQCTYIAVMKVGHSESLQVVHSSSCANH